MCLTPGNDNVMDFMNLDPGSPNHFAQVQPHNPSTMYLKDIEVGGKIMGLWSSTKETVLLQRMTYTTVCTM